MRVVLLSGGVDSAYILTRISSSNATALFVDYGQPSSIYEQIAAEDLCEHSLWPLRVVTIRGMNLGTMPDGIGPCIVPSRNLALIALAANWASGPYNEAEVWIGCAPQDESAYPDCRPAFLEMVHASLHLGSEVRLRTSGASRAERVKALGPRVVSMCWSCYGPGPERCGECASCIQ